MTGVSDLVNNESHKIKRPYNLVVIFLAFFTAIEVIFGYFNDLASDQADLQFLIRLGLIILAFAKAYLVAAFFMGIKYQPRPYVIYGVVFGVPLLIAIPVVIIPLIGTILHMTGH